MCGRYYIDEDAVTQIQSIVMRAEENLKISGRKDIFPTEKAPVIIRSGYDELSAELFPWGFPGFKDRGLVINARAESVFEKKMFRDSVRRRRCVIPAAGFYEWNREKEKYTFTKESGELLYLAGIYDMYDGENRFVILTTEANESMAEVHERMPLILSKEEMGEWILDDELAEGLLKKVPENLLSSAEYEQQTLKFL